MAGTTGLEPATSAVTGQRSNQTELRPLQSKRFARLAEHAVCRFADFLHFPGEESNSGEKYVFSPQLAQSEPTSAELVRTTKLSPLR